MHSAAALLIWVAFGLTILNGVTGKVPLFVPLLLICVALLVGR